MEKTALVTGANGFIGSHLATELVERGFFVYGLHRRERSNNPLYNKYVKEGKIKPILQDVKNLNINDLPKVEYVFHIAGKVRVWGKLKEFRQINVLGTKKLLEYARVCRVKCFTYLSSSAVYGFYGYKNIQEDAPKKPFKNPYPITKLEAENEVASFCKNEGMPYVIIRPCNVFGEYDYTSSHEIYTRVKNGKMMISAGGKYESCFVYVKNLVEAILHTAFTKTAQNQDYNVSDGNETLKEYLTMVANAFNVKPKFTNFAKPLAKLTACLVEGVYKILFIKKAPIITRFTVYQNCTHYSFSTKKLKSVGYEKKYSMEQGVKNTANWIEEVLKSETKN